MRYALGWEGETYHGETVIGHNGCTSGFGCGMLYLPRLNWCVAIFGYTTTAYMAEEKICWTLIDDLLNVPAEKRFDWDEHRKEDEEEPECETKEELYLEPPATPIPLTLPPSSYAGSCELSKSLKFN